MDAMKDTLPDDIYLQRIAELDKRNTDTLMELREMQDDLDSALEYLEKVSRALAHMGARPW